MFGSQEEITNKQLYTIIINIVGCNYLHESIISNFNESTDSDYSGRVKVVSIMKSDQLIYSNESNKEPGFGMLNLTWMRKTLNYRPATVIIVYDIRNKPENITYKDYESSIFMEITKIKKSDNYPFTNIILLIYGSNSSFTFDSYSEDKERSYNLKKLIDLKNIFYISGVDGFKTIAKKFCSTVMKLSLNYYRAIKKNLKVKKNNSVDIKEKIIKYNIKLGIISQIKNRKRNLNFIKYYEEAYSMLQNIDFKNYYFGSNLVKWNYLEIKSVADWLLFKIIHLKSNDLQNSIQSLINMFVFHMGTYSKIELLNEGHDGKNEIIEETSSLDSIQKLVFVEYFWSAIRNEFFAKFLEENFKQDFYIKNYLNFPGYYYMLASFNLSRLIKFSNKSLIFQLQDKNSLSSSNPLSSININSLKMEDNKFYGKPPKFYYQIDPLTRKETKYEDAIYLKFFINTNNLSQEIVLNRLMDNLAKAQKLYQSHYIIGRDNINSNTMTIYFNILSVISNENYSNNYEKMKYLYKTFISTPNLAKFPKIYLKYLEEYNKILISENNSDSFITILNNLISISALRNLERSEEEIFLNLVYNQTEKEIKQKFTLTKSNRIFSFDYSVSENNPKLFDVVEYKFNFHSCLNFDSLKVKSINFIFNNQERNKTFFEETYEISKDKNFSLSYKILIKESDKHLKLKTIRCELLTKESNVIFFEINNKPSKDKIINIKPSSLKLLEFKFPKKVKCGIGQYYHFECELAKCDSNINIEDINLKFEIVNEAMKADMDRISKSVLIQRENINLNSNFLGSNSIQSISNLDDLGFNPIHQFNHEFILKNSNSDKFSIFHNHVLLKITRIDGEPIKCAFLLKFNEKDSFSLKFDADYKIIKKEIYDDHILMKINDVINFSVVEPFNTKSEFFCDTYMSIQKQKVFPIQKNIKMNFTLSSNLDAELRICDIKIKKASPISNKEAENSNEQVLSIESPLAKILQAINQNQNQNRLNQNFTIRALSEFNIPFYILCCKEFSGNLGSVIISYRDKDLETFDDSFKFFNQTELAFPNLFSKIFDIKLSCSSPNKFENCTEIPFNITLKNESEEFRRIVFMIDTSMNYLTSGHVKKKLILYPKEIKELSLSLIPVTFSCNKLPPFKIMEFPLANNTYENKIYSIYYLPEASLNINMN